MKLKNTFTSFDTFVLRTPLFPIDFYTNLIENYSSELLQKTLETPFVTDAIALASPELLTEVEKLKKDNKEISSHKKINLEISLLKYIARLSARATPFGLFAGCSTGVLHNQTAIVMDAVAKHNIFTQLDMQYWIGVLQEFAKNTAVIKKVVYYPNSTLYKIADFYRYIEYQMVAKKREHTIAAVKVTPVLELILEHAKNGLFLRI